MLYAQFYRKDSDGTYREGVGDRAVIILDGRHNSAYLGRIAEEEARKRGYVAWRIFRGESFSRSSPISQLWPVRSVDVIPASVYDNY